MSIEITPELLATIKQKGKSAQSPPPDDMRAAWQNLFRVEYDFVLVANIPVVLALVAEVERLRAENETVTEIMHAQQKQLLMLYGIKPEDVQ